MSVRECARLYTRLAHSHTAHSHECASALPHTPAHWHTGLFIEQAANLRWAGLVPRTAVEYRQSAPTARVQDVVQLGVARTLLHADQPGAVVGGERLLQRFADGDAGLLVGERGLDGAHTDMPSSPSLAASANSLKIAITASSTLTVWREPAV